MADNSQGQNISYRAGEAKAHAQMNTEQMINKASNAANSVQQSCQETGSQMKAKGEGAVDAIKNATGTNK